MFQLLSHEVLPGIFVARVTGVIGSSTHCTAGFTLDGLYYRGRGATVREALLDLARNVDEHQPALNTAQTMFPLTSKRGSMTEWVKHLDLWQKICNKGEVFLDRPTGREERIVTILPNGWVVMENTYGRTPQTVPVPSPEKPPVLRLSDKMIEVDLEQSEPLCDLCGGDPDECHYRQVDVDQFTCDNSARRGFI